MSISREEAGDMTFMITEETIKWRILQGASITIKTVKFENISELDI